jgi:hypothetical protein
MAELGYEATLNLIRICDEAVVVRAVWTALDFLSLALGAIAEFVPSLITGHLPGHSRGLFHMSG